MGDGSCVDDGIYIMFREIVENAIDEFLIGCANRVEISIDYATGETSVRDNGRGVPHGKIRVAFGTEWIGGGMFDSDEYVYKPLRNHIGANGVNVLSEWMNVCSWREGKMESVEFARGEYLSEKTEECVDPHAQGTLVRWKPDSEIFGRYAMRQEIVLKIVRQYAKVNPGLSILLDGQEVSSIKTDL